MDRGYSSAELIDAVVQANYKFVMRCSSEFLRNMNISAQDNILVYQFSKLKHPTKIRVIKVQLSPENTEYLVTNLFDSDITVDEFRDLYHKRWGIENKYNDIENKLEIENFTGYSPDAILQDFYASTFFVKSGRSIGI